MLLDAWRILQSIVHLRMLHARCLGSMLFLCFSDRSHENIICCSEEQTATTRLGRIIVREQEMFHWYPRAGGKLSLMFHDSASREAQRYRINPHGPSGALRPPIRSVASSRQERYDISSGAMKGNNPRGSRASLGHRHIYIFCGCG